MARQKQSRLRSAARPFVETAHEWFADKAPTYAAALSYHMLLALAPLVIIAVGVVSVVFQSTEAVDEVVRQIEEHLGAPTADAVQVILDSVQRKPGANVVAMTVGAVILLVMAASAFRALRKAFNATWNVEPVPLGTQVRTAVRALLYQVLLLGLVLAVGLIAAALVALSTLWSTLSSRLSDSIPASAVTVRLLDFVVSCGLATALFAALFAVVPLARLPRRYLWKAAALTALLFVIGKFGFGIYMTYSGTASRYGAAGSLVVFLIWVYYSSMILFYGSEWAKVLARHDGVTVTPRAGARRTGRAAPIE